MKRVLFSLTIALLTLCVLAACRNGDPNDSDSATKPQVTVSNVTTKPTPSTTPIPVTEPPKPPISETPVTTTEVPHPITTEPPVLTTQPVTTPPTPTTSVTTGTGPIIGDNDNYPDWGPVIPMNPVTSGTTEIGETPETPEISETSETDEA